MKTIDRTRSYYARIAGHIFADSLDFYLRAERGRALKAGWRSPEYRCAWLRPKAKVVPIDAARAKRRAR